MINSSIFLTVLAAVFKKDNKKSKENYSPVSILPYILKTYGTCMYKQMAVSLEFIFLKFQYGFQQGCIAEDWFLVMI